MVTQITPGKSFEVHPYCANDANKASDKEESVFFFHVSHQTRTSFPLLRTAEDGFWLQTRACFALKICFLYHERKARGEKRREENCLQSETYFKGSSKNSPQNLRWNELIKRHTAINNATRGNNMKDFFSSLYGEKGKQEMRRHTLGSAVNRIFGWTLKLLVKRISLVFS